MSGAPLIRGINVKTFTHEQAPELLSMMLDIYSEVHSDSTIQTPAVSQNSTQTAWIAEHLHPDRGALWPAGERADRVMDEGAHRAFFSALVRTLAGPTKPAGHQDTSAGVFQMNCIVMLHPIGINIATRICVRARAAGDSRFPRRRSPRPRIDERVLPG